MVHANAGAGGKPAETDFFRRPPAFLNFPRIFSVALHCVRTLLFVSALLQQQVMLPACKSPGSSWWYRSRPPCPDIFTAGLQTAASRILPYSAEISRPHRHILNLPFPLSPPPFFLGRSGSSRRSSSPPELRDVSIPPRHGGWVAAPRNIPGKSTRLLLLLPLRRALRGAEALPGVGGVPKAKFGEPKCAGAGGGSLAVEAERERGGVLGVPCGMVPLLCACWCFVQAGSCCAKWQGFPRERRVPTSRVSCSWSSQRAEVWLGGRCILLFYF